MKIGYKVLLMVFLFPLLLFAAEKEKQNTQGKPEVLAVESAQQWLEIIDAGNYVEGWENSSEYLKHAVPQDSFKQSLQGVRKPLGEMKNRTFVSSQYTTSLPAAPGGDYVVIQLKTEFENKADAVETLISKKEDGQWKVAGYYIK